MMPDKSAITQAVQTAYKDHAKDTGGANASYIPFLASVDPALFAGCPGFFDIVVADVPCSGEGMFRKGQRAGEEWSEENVALCAARQKRILADMWPALKHGGYLVYSTCTYEKVENDDNLQWAAQELGGEIVDPSNEYESCGVRLTSFGNLLKVGDVPGEGQWVGVVRKNGADRTGGKSVRDFLDTVRPIRNGISKGVVKGKDFVPDPDWALSIFFDRNEYPCIEVDKQTALHYLHRDTLSLPAAEPGYNVITYRGISLGFVKNIGKRCNNLYPQNRRILMDIR